MSFTAPPAFTTRPTLTGTFGMSASTHWLATASAQAVLERGGNAFDAAVAGGFVLHVVEPHLNGPGGDLVGIFATADVPGTPVVLMGQGPAPAFGLIWRVRDRHSFRRLGVEGQRCRAGLLWCTYVADPTLTPPRVAFALGRTLGPAVARNRFGFLLSAFLPPRGLSRSAARRAPAERSYIELTFDVERLVRRLPHVAVPPVS